MSFYAYIDFCIKSRPLYCILLPSAYPTPAAMLSLSGGEL